ncbi:TetR/AcrR family transcriptional regulator [Nocardioides sp. NPDC101246]|uniref:TetR/AcrR family transcriptional regulator n=1 Tax=Nocardioides sp. NPDC101246 TaxID=3364336 RepID=UPI00380BDC8D
MAHIPTEVRRQQFIEAAIVVIARVGVDGATTRRIAEEAHAPLATLHYCFQTKENLLWAIFEQLEETVRADLEAKVLDAKTAADISAELLNETIRRAASQPAANRAQLEIWLWAERNDQALARRQYDVYLDAWKGFLRAAEPPLPEDRVETVARVVLGLVDGLNMQLITHGDEELVLREAATATAMLAAYLD